MNWGLFSDRYGFDKNTLMLFRINLAFDIDSFTRNPLGKFAGYYLAFLKSPKRKKEEKGFIYFLIHAAGRVSLSYLMFVAYIYHFFIPKEK